MSVGLLCRSDSWEATRRYPMIRCEDLSLADLREEAKRRFLAEVAALKLGIIGFPLVYVHHSLRCVDVRARLYFLEQDRS